MLAKLIEGIVYLVSWFIGVAFMLLWKAATAAFRGLWMLIAGAPGGAPKGRTGVSTVGVSPPGASVPCGKERGTASEALPESEAHAFYSPPRAGESAAEPSAASADEPPAKAPRALPRRARRPRAEERWAGTLLEHGVGEFTDRKSGRKYSSYYVRLDTDAGDIVTRRGVELEQAIAFAGAQRGNRVELLFLGREPVEIEDSEPERRKWKNRWRIHVIN